MGWQAAAAIGAALGAAGCPASIIWRGVAGKPSGSCATACGKCSAGAKSKAEPDQVVTIGSTPSAVPRP